MATYSIDEVIDGGKTYSLEEVTGTKPKRNELTRQLGLTGRYLAEGGADVIGIFSNPIAAISNTAFGTNMQDARTATTGLLDSLGVPTPENATERVVGDISRFASGTGGIMGAANVGTKATVGATNGVMNTLASNPNYQLASSAGAGGAGGVARENGAGFGGQLTASLLGGVVAPLSMAGLNSTLGKTANTMQSVVAPQAIEAKIDIALKQADIDLSKFPASVQKSMRDDIAKALNVNSSLSPDAIRRLADYKAVGATPMRSSLTLKPADITRDRNLAKVGAGSRFESAQQLSNIQNQNNNTLIGALNTMGAGQADDAYLTGSKVISALENKNKQVKSVIDGFYSKARATDGRSARLDPYTFTQNANNALDDALLGGKLPSDVRNLLNKTAKGEMPLTVDVAEQFKTRIGDLQRSTNDMAERKALGLVRNALDNAPLIDGQGKGAIDAFKTARSVNASYMKIVEKTPALQAVRDGVEPDKFVQKFILGNGEKSNLMDVSALKNNIKGNKDAMQSVRNNILAHLKNQGTSGAADEVANLSQSSYNKALNSIGDRKLALFFKPDEVEQLKRIGRVASYEQVQPKGSAVNNSNSASALFNHTIDAISNYVPFGKAIVGEPVKNIQIGISSKNTLNPANALAIQNQRKALPPPLWGIAAGQGLLSTE